MANYPGRRRGTRRIVIWHRGKSHEWIVEGTKADGARFEASKRIELEAGGAAHVPRSAQPLLRLCRLYGSSVAGEVSSTTWRARRHILATLEEHLGDVRGTGVDLKTIDAYRAKRKAAGLSVSSVNTEVTTLLYVLRWAKARGYAVNVPKVKLPRPPEGRVRIWTPEQVSKLIEVTRLHDPWLLPMLLFLANTGCRKGEAIAAEWSWIDFEAGMIRIPASAEWSPKSGRAREVPMSDVVRAVLSGPRLSDRWVFPNRDGNRFAVYPDGRFKELQNLANVSGGSHTLRHCYASAFLQRNPDMFLLAKVLGHSHVRMTALYSHLLPSHLEAARNVVNIGGTMATGTPPTVASAAK